MNSLNSFLVENVPVPLTSGDAILLVVAVILRGRDASLLVWETPLIV